MSTRGHRYPASPGEASGRHLAAAPGRPSAQGGGGCAFAARAWERQSSCVSFVGTLEEHDDFTVSDASPQHLLWRVRDLVREKPKGAREYTYE